MNHAAARAQFHQRKSLFSRPVFAQDTDSARGGTPYRGNQCVSLRSYVAALHAVPDGFRREAGSFGSRRESSAQKFSSALLTTTSTATTAGLTEDQYHLLEKRSDWIANLGSMVGGIFSPVINMIFDASLCDGGCRLVIRCSSYWSSGSHSSVSSFFSSRVRTVPVALRCRTATEFNYSRRASFHALGAVDRGRMVANSH